jgi:di/tricarboxylate transporter
MDAAMAITVVVLVATVVVLVTERASTVVALAGAVAVLVITGVVDQSEALAGFSSPAPFIIAALYVMAAAASATGAISGLVERGLGTGAPNRAGLARFLASTTVVSSMVPNTPLVALLAPRVVAWCRRRGVPASRYLMPLSFASILGGIVTVIGTSTNLVVSDLLVAAGEAPLGFFEITPIGLIVASVGVVVVVILSPRMLVDRRPVADDLRDSVRQYTIAVRVVTAGPAVGKSIETAGLRHLDGVFVAGVERDGELLTAGADTVLHGDDTLYCVGDVSRVADLHALAGLESAEVRHLIEPGSVAGATLFEAVVAAGSVLANATLADSGFRTRYDAAVVAVHRAGAELRGKLGVITLRPGDVLLILADSGFAIRGQRTGDFSLITATDQPPPVARPRAWLVLLTAAVMLVATAAGLVSLLVASVVAAGFVVVVKVLSLAEARRAVNLNVVLTLALSIGLGNAVASSGLAAAVGDWVVNSAGGWGDRAVLAAVVVAGLVLTELVSNAGAVAVLFPVVVTIAASSGFELRTLAVALLIVASCSFLSPVGYQTNLMIYGMGGYRFTDFVRLGAPLTVWVAVATVIFLPLVMPLT